MGFRTGAYATVWEVKPGNGNYSDVRISISKKSRQTGEYETDFSGFVRFIGSAHENAAYLDERARIKIGECDVTNRYDKEKRQTYTNYAVFSFESVDGNGSGPNTQVDTDSDGFMSVPDNIDEDLPFV